MVYIRIQQHQLVSEIHSRNQMKRHQLQKPILKTNSSEIQSSKRDYLSLKTGPYYVYSKYVLTFFLNFVVATAATLI